MTDLLTLIVAKYNYWLYVILMMIGLYAMVAKNNLIKKLVGMNIFQTAIILFYVSIGYKMDATIPIIQNAHGGHGGDAAVIHAADYINPLPHVLMLTAIVVSVATFGVAMALAVRVYQRYQTLEEDELRMRLVDIGPEK
ncbi:MAG: cation:proton antiporter subunit C [Desulfobacula sp.]|uniref:cation:proton antiporter subunit C n=1 Tax=Desulfobacula sp. TaxID=2593537 RepID=UPI0025C0E12B|nr:cation:proton antiporter subunit C [Desulfobacula sp.]MCD4722314.1 cation:proton antiporter subunit C [Desulfobacula sp.]